MIKSTLAGLAGAAGAAIVVLSMAGIASAGGPPPTGSVSCGDVKPTAYCSVELQNLCTEIRDGGFKNDRDRFNLIGKVIEAADKINMDKFADADQKLGDIQQKVDALVGADKPKLDEASADLITYARIEASLCISHIGG